ncbi:2-alkenal reductase (NADP(+)-dependent) [Neolecta irregularis DAH-3]|uniref:2-alkenal reductase (NADP(+)-dependent) n=1 Tax=Neolecta irregularis (strain DAH-3) TaxID=1198029 RepID=A0A1U7LHW9_NEOID|nr:2-alkenal reductase (NADP(+)-dependent) [Neolecta irregularis DAH-3]|eukprot:OLL22247.1 2-alkenal reductase (NADP(+)-dependent) [Neolecta irregularis DAH-3]
MSQLSNNAVLFNNIPESMPVKGKDLVFVQQSFDLNQILLNPGDFVLQTLYLSLDPFMRFRMRDPKVKSYVDAFELGKPVINLGIGRVIKSENSQYPIGVLLEGILPFQEYITVVSNNSNCIRSVVKEIPGIPLSAYLGLLGVSCWTAFIGLYDIGRIKSGETIFVSAASGAVGQLVVQLAKLEGLRVIASAGSAEKVEFLKNELGCDEAFNYKQEQPRVALKKYCPNGLDVFFDNVGGATLEAALSMANDHARFIECGMISQYNSSGLPGPRNLTLIVTKRIRMEGFIISDHKHKFKEYTNKMIQLVLDRRIVFKEHVSYGIENAIDGLIGMLKGDKLGKALVKLAD